MKVSVVEDFYKSSIFKQRRKCDFEVLRKSLFTKDNDDFLNLFLLISVYETLKFGGEYGNKQAVAE